MQGRFHEENIADQLLRHLPIDGGAGLEVIIQPGLPGEDDQRAHPLPAHNLAGHHRLGDHGLQILGGLGVAEQSPEFHAAQPVQHPPQLRLEQDDQRQQSNRHKLVQNKAQGVKPQGCRQTCDNHHCYHRPGNAHGSGGADQGQQLVDQERNHGNIQIIRPLHSGELLHQIVNCLHHTFSDLFYVNF